MLHFPEPAAINMIIFPITVTCHNSAENMLAKTRADFLSQVRLMYRGRCDKWPSKRRRWICLSGSPGTRDARSIGDDKVQVVLDGLPAENSIAKIYQTLGIQCQSVVHVVEGLLESGKSSAAGGHLRPAERPHHSVGTAIREGAAAQALEELVPGRNFYFHLANR